MILVFPFLAISFKPKNTCRTLTHTSSAGGVCAEADAARATRTRTNAAPKARFATESHRVLQPRTKPRISMKL